MLSSEQKAYFDTFGFLVLRQVFSPQEVSDIGRSFEEVILRARNGQPFSAEKRQMVLGFAEQHPYLAALTEDDRIYNTIVDLLGPEPVWITSDGNLYVGDTQWHPDQGGRNLGYGIIKVVFYLDTVRADTGCLRVIPGSHREPLASALKPMAKHYAKPPEYPFGVTGREVPFFPLESDPGDVVFFQQALWHSSFGGSNRRRMFTLNYASKPTTAEHADFHRHNYEWCMEQQRKNPYGALDRLYAPEFLAGTSPRRRSLVQPLIEWGFR